jgi:hypothetical protein
MYRNHVNTRHHVWGRKGECKLTSITLNFELEVQGSFEFYMKLKGQNLFIQLIYLSHGSSTSSSTVNDGYVLGLVP